MIRRSAGRWIGIWRCTRNGTGYCIPKNMKWRRQHLHGRPVPTRMLHRSHSRIRPRNPSLRVDSSENNAGKKLKLLVKFNLVFVLLFLIGIGASGYISWELLQKNAQEEVAENARLMMTVAVAVRTYTSKQIAPLLQTQMVYSFLPQSVPAFSA